MAQRHPLRHTTAPRGGWWNRRSFSGVGWSALALVAGVLMGREGLAAQSIRSDRVRAHLTVLAADSMNGRYTGSRGAASAARYIAGQLDEMGLEPGGDSAFFQRVPLARSDTLGRRRLRLVSSVSQLERVPRDQRVLGVNVIAVLRGSHPGRRDEVVVVGAHYDHVGVGPAVDGDSIYNGADDDASGVAAVLEIARVLSTGPALRRSVVFLLTTGEEQGLLGTRWYLEHPTFPLASTVADLQIEMIGRPDPMVGGQGKGWLTGYDRSTVSELLGPSARAIVADPRPEQQFFARSDNYAFALRGIPAHTLSSYGMHPDYHRPSDEIEAVDIGHMTRLIEVAADGVRALANGVAPEWRPGGRPTPR